jgi:hypothetical protein
VTALDLEEIQPDVSIADLERRWGISRNALKARAKALGIELIRKGPTLTVWPGNQVADGDRLDAHCKAGGSLASFPGAVSVTPQASSDSSQLAVTPGLSLTPQDGSQLAVLAAAVAAAMPTASADPLRRAKALAEAADNALVLTTDELVAIGVKGVDGFADGDLAFGYAFSKHQQRNRTLWTVERVIGKKPVTDITAQALTAGKADKQVGFGLGATLAARGGATIFATNSLRSR